MPRYQLRMLVESSFTCSQPTVQKARARDWKLALAWYRVLTLVPVGSGSQFFVSGAY